MCVDEGQKLSDCWFSLADGRKKKEREKLIFDHVWFSRKTAILEGDAMYMYMYTGSIYSYM